MRRQGGWQCPPCSPPVQPGDRSKCRPSPWRAGWTRRWSELNTKTSRLGAGAFWPKVTEFKAQATKTHNHQPLCKQAGKRINVQTKTHNHSEPLCKQAGKRSSKPTQQTQNHQPLCKQAGKRSSQSPATKTHSTNRLYVCPAADARNIHITGEYTTEPRNRQPVQHVWDHDGIRAAVARQGDLAPIASPRPVRRVGRILPGTAYDS